MAEIRRLRNQAGLGATAIARRLGIGGASVYGYLEDVYLAPPVERESLRDTCEILVIGVGFAALILWYSRVRQTGFQWMGAGSFNMIVGRDGRTLRGKWGEEGVKAVLGLHSHGFPNLIIMSGPQSGGGQFNFTVRSRARRITWLGF
jgi:hypothetical protein